MNPCCFDLRRTADELKSRAVELRNRAQEARAATDLCGNPGRVEGLQKEVEYDLKEAGLLELAALGLAEEAGNVGAYEELLKFQEARK